jgi:hypothetical protein
MDGNPISPPQFCDRLGSASAPVLVDVRREDAAAADDAMIIGALRQPAEATARNAGAPTFE